jgi:uncharacterized membrane protein
MDYLIVKWIHVLSSTILFGTGLGSAFYMFAALRQKEIAGIAFATRFVVMADNLFTAPAALIQPATGLWLAFQLGLPMTSGWVALAILLYVFAGACWLPVVRIQIVMRDMAREAERNRQPLPDRFWHLARWWTTLGSLAFPSFVVIFYLMVVKPDWFAG